MIFLRASRGPWVLKLSPQTARKSIIFRSNQLESGYKKLLMLCAQAAACLALFGCGGQSDSRSDANTPAASQAAANPQLTNEAAALEIAENQVSASAAAPTAYPNVWNYRQIGLRNAVANSNLNPYPDQPGKKIRIAILDSGYSPHPDINWSKDAAGNVLKLTTDESNPANTDGPDTKHSLHVAGILGGINYKNLGRVGVCPQCEILSVKFAPPSGASAQQSDAHMAKGIRLAVDNGAKAINISIAAGGFGTYPAGWSCNDTPQIKAAVEYAASRKVAIVASAGNYGNADGSSQGSNGPLLKRDVRNISPSSCPGVIAVGASDQTGSIATSYSNHGSSQAVVGPSEIGASLTMTLIAPGGGVDATDGLYGKGLDGVFASGTEICDNSFLGNIAGQPATSNVQILSAWGSGSAAAGNAKSCYRFLSGTSMSAPHVTGVIGLMLSVQPGLSPQEIRGILRTTARKIDTTPACAQGGSGYCGSGLLNANAAVQKAKITLPSSPPLGTGPCSYNTTGLPCKLDVMAYDTDTSNARLQTIIAYGKMWQYNTAGATVMTAVDLRNIPRYNTGPCSKAPAGQACVIDSLTVLNHPEYGQIESISAYGFAWNFKADGSPWPASNFDLKTITRYGDGGPVFGGSNPTPCGPSGSMPCKFDTRELIDARDTWGDIFEGISAYGRYFIFRWDGTFLESNSLTSVARYAAGPCKYRPAGGLCTFDTSEKKRLNGQLIEVITAYGRYWEFAAGNDTPLPGSDVLLQDMARFK